MSSRNHDDSDTDRHGPTHRRPIQLQPSLTPMMRQFAEAKAKHPDAILFFRMGDFYEMFLDDAVKASRELHLTLTSRGQASGEDPPPPMCGVPHHAAETYIARLVAKGYKVAVCEQMEEPGKGRALLRRDIVRVHTPGTFSSPTLTQASESVFLACLHRLDDAAGLCFLDLSTGEFLAAERVGKNVGSFVTDEIGRLRPREVLVPSGQALPDGCRDVFVTEVDPETFALKRAERKLNEHFGTATLDGFGLSGKPAAVSAAGACLEYVEKTQKASLPHITSLKLLVSQDYLAIDDQTGRNLEILRNPLDGTSKNTLVAVVDETSTPMGARLLRRWLMRPSRRMDVIEPRLDGVAALARETAPRARLRSALATVSDLERILGRVSLKTASPRDMAALRASLGVLPEVRSQLAPLDSPILKELHDGIALMPELRCLLEAAIQEAPTGFVGEGGVIRSDFDPEFAETMRFLSDGRRMVAALQEKERAASGIASLKVRYNQVFGYYIEVSKANLRLVPPHYERRQTVANAERFVTPELKELEEKILGAEARVRTLEQELFDRVLRDVAARSADIMSTSHAVATVDVLGGFAECAVKRGYTRPSMNDRGVLRIEAGRHPVIEAVFPRESFVPNDVFLDPDADQIHIITGPNMGGKSTFLRQVGLITLLAHAGSFVPARAADIPLTDRIFTRVGASDNLALGQSTFMTEMIEAANILNNATRHSLILLDEVGRGTSTFDGLSLAWAIAEHIHNHAGLRAKTLFATHYHELTELSLTCPHVKNLHILVKEHKDQVIFLHKIAPGASDRSYGIHVAKLAGVPREVTSRAEEILTNLQKNEFDIQGRPRLAVRRGVRLAAAQPFLPFTADHPALDELRSADVDSMTPLQALGFLAEIQKRLKEED